MYLTISKRFEFSSSARQFRAEWDEARNRVVYGPFCQGVHGHGYNYVATLIFHGPVEPATGMMINVTAIKERARRIIDAQYDHKFLNHDTAAFRDDVPTAENLARHLLGEVAPLFASESAQPVACHLQESDTSAAIAYSDGSVERELWLGFSAARRTYSPHVSDEENKRLFGLAARSSGHGHGYRLRVVLGGVWDAASGVIVPHREWAGALADVHAELDHRNLNTDVPGLRNRPITTESLARYICRRLGERLPLKRAKLYELPHFFAECRNEEQTCLGIVGSFHAAHRLHSPALTDAQNQQVYGKCNNPEGHGHQYFVEATIGGPYDERTGTLYDFNALTEALEQSLQPWRYKHLDLDTGDFGSTPSTGENIVEKLWPSFDGRLDSRLVRLRLWETPNNRFTLRRAWRP